MEKAENADKNLTFDGLREAWRDCADCLHDSQQDEVDFCVNCFDSPGRPNFTLKPNATGAEIAVRARECEAELMTKNTPRMGDGITPSCPRPTDGISMQDGER